MSAPVRISAVISAYNCEAFLADAIDSVLAQTRPVDEIVVVDDGSTDDTSEVATSYADRGVRYVRQENQGAGAARNRGIRETSGDLIAFLDGDDMWLPDKTERQLAYLESHPEAAMVTGRMLVWNVASGVRQIGEVAGVPPARHLEREILIRNFVGNPSMVLLQRSILDRVGVFDASLRWGQDWELWMRIIANAPVGFLPEVVIVYRWHASNLTKQLRPERQACLYGISQRAVGNYRPRWWRPILRARVRGKLSVQRAYSARSQGRPRRVAIGYLALALLLAPFDDLKTKANFLGRLLLGPARFVAFRSRVVGRTDATPLQ